MLQSMIQQQFQDLGSLTNIGQASAARQAAAGQTAGTNISNIAQGNAWGSALGSIGNLFGQYRGFQAMQPPLAAAGTLSSLPVMQPYQSPIGIPTYGGG
jgi:hypothetical protein